MNKDTLTVSHLKIGEMATLVEIDPLHQHRNRLIEMGFTSGSPLKIVRKAIFGDPILIRVKNSQFAIRKADAGFIRIARSA